MDTQLLEANNDAVVTTIIKSRESKSVSNVHMQAADTVNKDLNMALA